MRPQLLVTQALIAPARGDQETAERPMKEADRFVEERDMQYLRPMVAWAFAQVLAAAGERERALERLGAAETVAAELQLRPWLSNILLLEAALLADLGRTGESAAKAARHIELTRELADLMEDPELRASYLEVWGVR